MTERMKDTLLGLYDFQIGRQPNFKRQRFALAAAIRISYDTMTDGEESNRNEVIKELAEEANILTEAVEELLDFSAGAYVSMQAYRTVHQHIANEGL